MIIERYVARLYEPQVQIVGRHLDRNNRIEILQEPVTYGRILFRDAGVLIQGCYINGTGADGAIVMISVGSWEN